MVRTACSLVAIAALHCGASAEQTNLWRDIDVGMSVEEVRSIYPEGKSEGRHVEHHKSKTELHGFVDIGKCKPRVEIHHSEGLVSEVVIWMRPQGLKRMCAEDARAATLGRFGEPLTSNNRAANLNDLYRTDSEEMTWLVDGKMIVWSHRSRDNRWSIRYSTKGESGGSQL